MYRANHLLYKVPHITYETKPVKYKVYHSTYETNI